MHLGGSHNLRNSHTQMEETMQKWEYMEISCHQDQSGEWFWSDTNQSSRDLSYVQRMNQLGQNGWELVTVAVYADAWTYIFKRSTE